jgi:hypothetical protein
MQRGANLDRYIRLEGQIAFDGLHYTCVVRREAIISQIFAQLIGIYFIPSEPAFEASMGVWILQKNRFAEQTLYEPA